MQKAETRIEIEVREYIEKSSIIYIHVYGRIEMKRTHVSGSPISSENRLARLTMERFSRSSDVSVWLPACQLLFPLPAVAPTRDLVSFNLRLS